MMQITTIFIKTIFRRKEILMEKTKKHYPYAYSPASGQGSHLIRPDVA